uniref:C2H2-type domain-containing protein n=1 Tax=Strongyloides venezuelensis TaxID=75913 RepID=A0A0K0FMS0_STRVS
MVEYYNLQISLIKDNKYVVTESWLDNEMSYGGNIDEERNVKWNKKILNIPFIDEDIATTISEKEYKNLSDKGKSNFLNYLSLIPSINDIISSNYNMDCNLMNDKLNHTIKKSNSKKSISKYNIFERSNKKNYKNIDRKKKNSIDYIEIYLTSIYNNNQHPLHYSLKNMIGKCKNELLETSSELLYREMMKLFKSELKTSKMSMYIESIMKDTKHPLNEVLCCIKNSNLILEESSNNTNAPTPTLSMSINSIQSIIENDNNENSKTISFSNSHNSMSISTFAHSFLTSVVEIYDDDDDILLGGEVAAEDDIDKDNWNNFQWNGQERPSLKELGCDDAPKSFWNSEIWNSNDYNQNLKLGKNIEMLEYCGAKGLEDDISVDLAENVDIQDDYLLIGEDDIIQALSDELESCCYEIS